MCTGTASTAASFVLEVKEAMHLYSVVTVSKAGQGLQLPAV